MTLDQLRAFVAVAEREHLTQAAAALNLTPSAVSSAVQTVEMRYGTHLFHRIGRRIELSSEGRRFLPDARAVLAAASLAERTLKELNDLASGTLAIAASKTIASYWLSGHLTRFTMKYRAITLTVDEMNTSEVACRVRKGIADIGFIEGIVSEDDLSSSAIAADNIIIISSIQTTLASDEMSMKYLLSLPWVMRETGSGTRSVVERTWARHGADVMSADVVLELPSNEAVCQAVSFCDDVIAAVPELVARHHIAAGRLRQIGPIFAERNFALVRHKSRFLSKAASAFEKMLHENLA